jgi:hypothetical protein
MNLKLIIILITLLFLSCSKDKKVIHEDLKSPDNLIDSVIVEVNKQNEIIRVYSFLNTPEKPIKEMITFQDNNKIDFTKSTFLEVKNDDLYFYSHYSKYPIPKKRFIQFIFSDSINSNFDNFSKIKLDTAFFNIDGVIEDYKSKLSKKGKIVETVFLDSLVVKNNEEQKVIRTLEYYVDLDNLLIDNLKAIRKTK